MNNNKPVYSFTVPSLHDDLPLDCRIYHPRNFSTSLAGKGAVVAHPYPPLGGSQDDNVVLSVTDTLLREGYVVVTFNFRGAEGSAGRTSWTGRPEVDDFASVVGLLFYYVQSIVERPREHSYLPPIDFGNDVNVSGAHPQSVGLGKTEVELLLAGYSFGSLILARLPSISSILRHFDTADRGTSASEIYLRARTLAKQTRASFDEHEALAKPRGRLREADPSAVRSGSVVVMGGEETSSSERRMSRDKHHSLDLVRDIPHRLKARVRHRSSASQQESDIRTRHDFMTGAHRSVHVKYLLISPILVPLTSMLLPPGFPLSLGLATKQSTSKGEATSGLYSFEHPSLMLFGEVDSFTSAKRLRQWANSLNRESSGQLQWMQVDGAGHFWQEKGVMRALQDRVGSWLSEDGSHENS